MRASDNPFRAQRLNGPADYVPELDVPEFGQAVLDTLRRDVDALRGARIPDPSRQIHVLAAAAGTGKTHLFARLGYEHDDGIVFAFVPAVDDKSRPMEHVRWHMVESLFREDHRGAAPIDRALARMCHRDVLRYLDGLPSTLRDRHRQLRARVEEDPLAVLEIARGVTASEPFLRLAASAVASHPRLRGDIVRALCMAWSPARHDVRRWLRGEALPEARARALELSDDECSSAREVIGALAEILGHEAPVVLCLDQIETVLESAEGPTALMNALVDLLQSVPNLLIVVSCLADKFEALEAGTIQSVRHRLEVHSLPRVGPDHLLEVVRRRLRSLAGRPAGADPLWPFDEAALRGVVSRSEPVLIRPLLMECSNRLDAWREAGGDGTIRFEAVDEPRGSDIELLRAVFEQELRRVRTDPKRGPLEVSEARIHRGIREAIEIVGRYGSDAVRAQVAEVTEDAVRSAQAQRRYSLRVSRADGSGRVVAVSKHDNGTKFRAWFLAALEAIHGPTEFVVVVRDRDELPKGPATRTLFETSVSQGRVRTISLTEAFDSHARMETCVALLDRAAAGELDLDGELVDPSRARELIAAAGVLDGLEILETVLDIDVVGETAPAPQPEPAPSSKVVAPVAGEEDVRSVESPGGAVVAGRRPATGIAVRERSPDASNDSDDDDDPGGGGAQGRRASAEAIAGGSATRTVRETVDGDGGRGGGRGARADSARSAGAAGPAATDDDAWATERLREVVDKLRQFGVRTEPGGVSVGPTFARLRVRPVGGASISKVRNKAEDLKIHLALESAPIIDSHGGFISVDIQRPSREVVPLRALLESIDGAAPGRASFPVGVDISGRARWLDLARPSSCHVLVAGTTGSGKSEFLKAMIAGLAARHPPESLQLVLVDPKRVTFNLRGSSPYLPRPIAYSVDEALPLLEECFDETERRYRRLAELHLDDISELPASEAVPRVVVVFDEFADLMVDKEAKRELERPLRRLGAKARAAGVHLVLATQRPEASVVTPLLRSNLPARVALKVASERDSRLVLDSGDAAHLLGRGDLLYGEGGGAVRLQSAYVTADELELALRVHR